MQKQPVGICNGTTSTGLADIGSRPLAAFYWPSCKDKYREYRGGGRRREGDSRTGQDGQSSSGGTNKVVQGCRYYMYEYCK